MATVSVEAVGGDEFRVLVDDGAGTTEHRVTADPATVAELAGPGASAPEVVRKSFDFLLAREPKDSIMRRFDLTVIERYFPEYRQELARLLG